jgi:hypothetical protein
VNFCGNNWFILGRASFQTRSKKIQRSIARKSPKIRAQGVMSAGSKLVRMDKVSRNCQLIFQEKANMH